MLDKSIADCLNIQSVVPLHNYTVQDVLSDSLHSAWQFCPEQLSEDLQKFSLQLGNDIPVWSRTNSGSFSTKSTYSALVDNLSELQDIDYSNLWYSKLPPRASVFGWRLLMKAIPVDQQVQLCGVQLASCCVCCHNNHAIEDLDHLFVDGNVAQFFWTTFAGLIKADMMVSPHILNRLHGAISEGPLNHPLIFISLFLIISIIWHIWKIRCSARFEGVILSCERAVDQIVTDLRFSLSHIVFKQGITSHYKAKLHDFGLSVFTPIIAFSLVRWKSAEILFTLNVDGSSKGNPGPSGGGGSFRSHSGQFKLGFSYFYGIGSNMVAESRALLDGLRLAKLHSIPISAIHSDSKALVTLLTTKDAAPPWSLLPWWEELKSFILTFHCPIMHIFREGNQLADALAKYAVQTGCNHEFFSLRELPCVAKGYVIADANGLPNFRKRLVHGP